MLCCRGTVRGDEGSGGGLHPRLAVCQGPAPHQQYVLFLTLMLDARFNVTKGGYDLSILSDFPVSDVVFSYSIADYRGTDSSPKGVLSEGPQCRTASGHAAAHIPRPGALLLWSALLSPEKTKQFPAGVLQGEKGQVSLHNYLRDF